MIFDALILGGGVAGMQCALVLGSGLKKPYAINKKVGGNYASKKFSSTECSF